MVITIVERIDKANRTYCTQTAITISFLYGAPIECSSPKQSPMQSSLFELRVWLGSIAILFTSRLINASSNSVKNDAAILLTNSLQGGAVIHFNNPGPDRMLRVLPLSKYRSTARATSKKSTHVRKKERRTARISPLAGDILRTTVKPPYSMHALRTPGGVLKAKAKALLRIPNNATDKDFAHQRIRNRVRSLRQFHRAYAKPRSENVYEAQLLKRIEQDELHFLGNKRKQLFLSPSSFTADDPRRYVVVNGKFYERHIKESPRAFAAQLRSVAKRNKKGHRANPERRASNMLLKTNKLITTGIKLGPPTITEEIPVGKFISFHTPTKKTLRPKLYERHRRPSAEKNGKLLFANRNRIPTSSATNAVRIHFSDQSKGITYEESESEWQQPETFNETPLSTSAFSASSQIEEGLNLVEEHTVPPYPQTIVPASTVIEPNWDDNNDDNHHKQESDTNEEIEEELVTETPFPFSHCYMNINGFMCCNRSLELQMRRTYRQLRHSTPSYTSCNIQKLANLIQRDVERKFSTQFEAIVALDDFVVHSHFVSDLTCKIEIDGRYIAVYASHNSSIDEEKRRDASEQVPNSEVVTEFAHNVRDRYLYNKTDTTSLGIDEEQNNEDQLDGEPLVVNVDQPIPRYNNTGNMFSSSHAMRSSIDEKTPHGSLFSEDHSVTQKLLSRNLPSIANDKTTENVWIHSIKLTQSTEPTPTSAQAMKNSLASPVTLSEGSSSVNSQDMPNVLMVVFNESKTSSNRWSTLKPEVISARETATEKTIKNEVKGQNSSRSIDEAIRLLRALLLKKFFSSPAFGNTESTTLAVPLELSTPTMNDNRFQTRVLSTQTQQTNFEGPLQPLFMNPPHNKLVDQMSQLHSNEDVMHMFRPVHLEDESESRSTVMPVQANEAMFSKELQPPDSLFVSESSSAPKLYSRLPGPSDQTAATEATGDRIQLESSTAGSTGIAMITREDAGVSAYSVSDAVSEIPFLTDQPVLETERTGTTLPDPVDIAGWEHYAENHLLIPVGPVENSGNGPDAPDISEVEPFNNAPDITAPEFLGG